MRGTIPVISGFILSALVLCGTASGQPSADGPLKIGVTDLVDIHSPHPYSPGRDDAQVVWTETLHKEDATFVRVHFTDATLLDPEGLDTLVVRDRNGHVVATFRGDGATDRWTPAVEGERLTLELVSHPGGGGFGVVLDKVAWGTRPLFPVTPVAGFVDYTDICDAQVASRIRGADPVASLMWEDDCGGSFVCTGWLFSPLGHLMTNAHCANTQTEANSVECRFNYMNPACDLPTRPLNPDTFMGRYDPVRGTGIKFEQMNCNLDYSILIVHDPRSTKGNPADYYGFLDVSLSRPLNGTELWLPQHPFGNPKLIAENCIVTDNLEPGWNGCNDPETGCSGEGFFVGTSDLRFDCRIEGGSSGSPVLNISDQVVAIAHATDPEDRSRNFGVRITEIIRDVPNVPVRLVIQGPDVVLEGDAAQYTGVVSYLFTSDREFQCAPVTWSVASASAGSITTCGLFTAGDVLVDRRTTISASYTANGKTVTGSMSVTIRNVPELISIVAGNPPDGAVDARQPSALDGTEASGWENIRILFDGDASALGSDDFAVSLLGGSRPPPSVAFVLHPAPEMVELFLTGPIEAGARTTMIHKDSGTSVQLGFLPGDVDGDGTNAVDDVEVFIAALDDIAAGKLNPLPEWSSDIDLSGAVNPGDLVREMDLHNGADLLDMWMGISLP